MAADMVTASESSWESSMGALEAAKKGIEGALYKLAELEDELKNYADSSHNNPNGEIIEAK